MSGEGKPGPRTRRIQVKELARVEGEGGLLIRIKDERIVDVKLNIFEPPRFFEAFLRGRSFGEAPDITARICGICPVAYQMSSCHAMENACGVRVEGPLRDLRRLLYCGEWIQSHALHVYLLHAPDFLGYESALHMARDHADVVQRGLQLKKVGNDLLEAVGGRAVHPVNVRVGGFYRAPRRRELRALTDRLERARDAALETVRWVGGFDFPDFDQDYHFVSLRHPSEYPFNEGRIVSSAGLDIDPSEFGDHFVEEHVEHSTALHGRRKGGKNYHVGPLARYNLNFDRLSETARQAAREVGMGPYCLNPFRSIVVRAVETVYACDEALRIIEAYSPPESPSVEVTPRPGTGHGCTEAPRGMLYHRYRLDDRGDIADAAIVPPTAQNQPTIEEDLKHFAGKYLDLPDEKLQWRCEQAVRNYDPCISCSTHFLRLDVRRE